MRAQRLRLHRAARQRQRHQEESAARHGGRAGYRISAERVNREHLREAEDVRHQQDDEDRQQHAERQRAGGGGVDRVRDRGHFIVGQRGSALARHVDADTALGGARGHVGTRRKRGVDEFAFGGGACALHAGGRARLSPGSRGRSA